MRKSTLLGLVANGRDADWRNLDAAVTRQAAAAIRPAFVDSAALMVIDEIQRVPELLLAIKEQVDADPRPAATCSPDRRACWRCAACRTRCPAGSSDRTVAVLQGEIDGAADRFVDAIFDQGEGLSHESAVSRRIMPNGSSVAASPEALARTNPAPSRAPSSTPTWRI